jgi:hypothetical protein
VGGRGADPEALSLLRKATMYNFAGESAIDLDALRARLARMNDAALERFGRAAAYTCSPEASLGKPPREVFVIQLREAREEWRRRSRARKQASTPAA